MEDYITLAMAYVNVEADVTLGAWHIQENVTDK